MLKKNDIILISSVVAAAIILSSVFLLTRGTSGKTVTVKENNKTVYSGALDKDHTIKLSGNTVIIKDSTVWVSEADCKNQICVRHKKISKNGESIVCLPNKVIIEIGG